MLPDSNYKTSSLWSRCQVIQKIEEMVHRTLAVFCYGGRVCHFLKNGKPRIYRADLQTGAAMLITAAKLCNEIGASPNLKPGGSIATLYRIFTGANTWLKLSS